MKGYMTVGELVELLKRQPSELKVILSRDAEGNGYALLSEARLWEYTDSDEFFEENVDGVIDGEITLLLTPLT